MVKKIFFIISLVLFCLLLNAQITPSGTTIPASLQTVSPIPAAYGSNIKVNFIRSWIPQKPMIDPADVVVNSSISEVQQSTEYFDGLGRPLQSVNKKASPTGNDLVSMHVYDEFGREAQKYLPYMQSIGNTNDGELKLNPFVSQATFMHSQFPGEQVYYGQTQFEASPLNRPLKILAPGNSWAGSDRGVRMNYEINETNEVRVWSIGTANGSIPTSPGYYLAGQLFRTVITDEHGKKVIEYKDKEGRVVLKKVQINDNPSYTASGAGFHAGWLSTYYIYDDFGLLRFVIPPLATKKLDANGWNFSANQLANVVDELCFQYSYDERNRMIEKKVPGAAWVFMVYDKRDRLVFTQDGNMRSKSPNCWMYTLYDELNRPIQTGMMLNNITRINLQDYVNMVTGSNSQTLITDGVSFISNPQADLLYSYRDVQIQQYHATNSIIFQNGFESSNTDEFIAEIVNGTSNNTGTTISVSDNPIPTGSTTIPLTYSFYDNYQQTNKVYTTVNNNKLTVVGSVGVNVFPENLPITASTLTKGMPTVTRVRVIEDANNLALGNWLETATFYDENSRPIQTIADNYKGGKDIITSLYDFSGKILTTYLVHNNPVGATANQRVRTQMVYDHAGRLIEVYKQINDDANSERRIVHNSYNGLGQLITKDIGQKKNALGNLTSTSLEIDDYTYNIRGWLKGVNWNYNSNISNPLTNIGNNKWFGFDLSYDWGFTQNQYNGNIAGQRWMSAGDLTERAFGYNYDNANRLLFADFNQNNGSNSSPIWNKNLTSSGNGSIDFSVKMGDGIDYTKAYDENGNILQMQQMGLNSLNSSASIDNLKYYYNNNSNKLQNVIDLNNITTTQLGDFKTVGTHTQFSTKQSINTEAIYNANIATIATIADYGYDVNGNLITDRNKDIKANNSNGVTGINQNSGGIIYNHLNLPYQITVAGKGTITYIYDAAGNKLEKRTTDITNAQPTVQNITTYLGGFVYENNSLQFFGHEEGRIRQAYNATQNKYDYRYDYMLKDHLGNVRAVLTDERKQDTYPAATLEGDLNNTASAAYIEKQYYQINPSAVISNPQSLPNTYPNNNGNPPYNNNPNSNNIAISQKVYKLNGQNGEKTGLGITLKVMAGDNVDIRGISYWHSNSAVSNNYPITGALLDFLNAFISSTPASSITHGGVTGTLLNNTPNTASGLNNWLNNTVPTPLNKPKAYINWILFDDLFKPVASSSGFDPVKDLADDIKNHSNSVNIEKNGFLYVYCSNESNQDVFFDNLQVTHDKGALLEETHYYPFGLTMSGISSKAAGGVENKYKYNGIEFNKDFDLNLGEAFFRSHDPQIGRWWQIDPKPSDMMSPYAAMENNPISKLDFLGDTTYMYTMKGVYKGVIYDGLKTNEVVMLGDKNLAKALEMQKGGTASDELAGIVRGTDFAGARITGNTISSLTSKWNSGDKNETGGYLYIDPKTKEVKVSECTTCGTSSTSFSMDKLVKTYDDVSKKGQILGVWHTHPANGFNGSQPSPVPEDYNNPLAAMKGASSAVGMIVTKNTGTIYPVPATNYQQNRRDNLVTTPTYSKDYRARNFTSDFQYGTFNRTLTPKTYWKQ